MQENVPLRKYGTITAPFMNRNVNFNIATNDSYSTQIRKYGSTTVNDRKKQELSNYDGSRNSFSRYRSLGPTYAENSSKRFSTNEQIAFDMPSNMPQNIMDRDYSVKSFRASSSMKRAAVGQNNFTSFANGVCSTIKTQADQTKQEDGFTYELSMTAISRKISNEYGNKSQHCNSNGGVISAQEYMRRLLQAHQIVDELLRLRCLKADCEIDYLRNWYQKFNREPETEEKKTGSVSGSVTSKCAGSLNTSEILQQRCSSNASDSGLSTDAADSENDQGNSQKIQEINSQNFIVTNSLPPEKQETVLVKSIKVHIVKKKKHEKICSKMIIWRVQPCRASVGMTIRLEKKGTESEKMTDGNVTKNSKKNCNKKRKMVGDQVEDVKSKNQAVISEKNFPSQKKRFNQDYKVEKDTAIEPLLPASNQEANTTKSSERKTGRKHKAFSWKSKNEAVNVCYHFVNKLRCLNKATISFSISVARRVTLKPKKITTSGKRILHNTGKEQKLKCYKDDSLHAFLLEKTEKRPFDQQVFSELQNTGKRNEIIVAREKGNMIEKDENMTKIASHLNANKKHSSLAMPTKKSVKKLKSLEESLSSVPHVKKIATGEKRNTSANNKQATVSKDLCLQSKSQSETAMTVSVSFHKTKITKRVPVKTNPSILRKKEFLGLRKFQKALQNYTIAKPKYYQNMLQPINRNKSNTMRRVEQKEITDICRARQLLRHINFRRASVRLESSTSSSFHRISEGPAQLTNEIITSLNTSSELSSSVLSVDKKRTNKNESGPKINKDQENQLSERLNTFTEDERYHCRDKVPEGSIENLDGKVVNTQGCTQYANKPQAKIPAWNINKKQKEATNTILNSPKLRRKNPSTSPPVSYFPSTSPPVSYFIGVRTPALDVAVKPSIPAFATAVLRHVPTNHSTDMSPSLENILSSDGGTTIASDLQQHVPSNQFVVATKCVDRSKMQKSKSRGAQLQSAPMKSWIPKGRRIQRMEEEDEDEDEEVEEEVEEEEDEEAILVVEANKDEHRNGDNEQEEKQMPIRLLSQVTVEKNGKDLTEAEKAIMVAKRRQMEEETTKLQKYEEQRRIEREREEEELRKLKEKKERRKVEREKEEQEFQEKLKQEEERRKQEEEERKAKIEAEKRKKEDEKRKRHLNMLSSQFANTTHMGRNFVIHQKSDKTDKFGNIVQAKQEMGMTKEQQEEAKRNYLISVKHTIEFEKLTPSELREKIRQLHQRICKLEADKYDLEKRHERQEYDLRELNERQRQVARNKALKKGLDLLDTNSRHPPKVSIVSKYDRQIDRRNFGERRAIFENKNAYPCFPHVPPSVAINEKMIRYSSRADESEDEDNEVNEQEDEEVKEEEEEKEA